jgi:hypothetical protein
VERLLQVVDDGVIATRPHDHRDVGIGPLALEAADLADHAQDRQKDQDEREDEGKRVAAQNSLDQGQALRALRGIDHQQPGDPDEDWDHERADEHRQADPVLVDEGRDRQGREEERADARERDPDEQYHPHDRAQGDEDDEDLLTLGDAAEEERARPAERGRQEPVGLLAEGSEHGREDGHGREHAERHVLAHAGRRWGGCSHISRRSG